MPKGGVTVDLAASTGGNIETTVKDTVATHSTNNVKMIGFTNMNSRMPGISSTLFSGNLTKLLQDMSTEREVEEGKQYEFAINEDDEAVRSMLAVKDGKVLDPYVPPERPAQVSKQQPTETKEVDLKAVVYKNSLVATALTGSGITLGSQVPDVGMLSTLGLSIYLGSLAVRGVAHSLHSPLMSITNAISGMTIIGGMLQLGGGLLPGTTPQVLATVAVGLSAVNLTGGFLITKKMLDMFRRPTDPPVRRRSLTPFSLQVSL